MPPSSDFLSPAHHGGPGCGCWTCTLKLPPTHQLRAARSLTLLTLHPNPLPPHQLIMEVPDAAVGQVSEDLCLALALHQLLDQGILLEDGEGARSHSVGRYVCVGVPCIERSAPRPTTIIVSRISILPPSAGLPPGPLAPLPSLWTVPFPIVMYPRSHLRALPPITLQPSTLHHLQLLLQALDLIDEAFFFLRGGGGDRGEECGG